MCLLGKDTRMAVNIPVMPKPYPLPERDYPISPRENLMLAFDHKKPMWMPSFYESAQHIKTKLYHEKCQVMDGDGYDWFGTFYKYIPAQGGTTPMPGLFDEIYDWEEKMVFPDFDDKEKFDWEADAANFTRDESKALFMRFSNGCWERLHACEGFEQALIDLISEPELTKEYFDRMVDYKIDMFNHFRNVYPLDFLMYADDYGTQNGPFFSTELFEEVMLDGLKRLVAAVQAKGTKFVFHCCGKIDPFIPYFIDELHVDGLEIQEFNDIKGILEKYGDKVLVELNPDSNFVYDDERTPEEFVEYGRKIVDEYGAQCVPGSGVAFKPRGYNSEVWHALEGAVYDYSSELYRGL